MTVREVHLRRAADDDRCPNCGGLLYDVDPDIDTWRHYCEFCERLTLTVDEVHNLTDLPPGSIGRIISVGCHIEIEHPHQVTWERP